MKKEDIEKIIGLRQYVIDRYNELPDPTVGTSIQSAREVSRVYVDVIRSIEDILTGHVTFEKAGDK